MSEATGEASDSSPLFPSAKGEEEEEEEEEEEKVSVKQEVKEEGEEPGPSGVAAADEE